MCKVAPSLESTADTQPQLQPALLRLSAMISQYFIESLPFSLPDAFPTPPHSKHARSVRNRTPVFLSVALQKSRQQVQRLRHAPAIPVRVRCPNDLPTERRK